VGAVTVGRAVRGGGGERGRRRSVERARGERSEEEREVDEDSVGEAPRHERERWLCVGRVLAAESKRESVTLLGASAVRRRGGAARGARSAVRGSTQKGGWGRALFVAGENLLWVYGVGKGETPL
jgi:hypothetical protein